MNSKCGGMNAHQTIGMVRVAAKAPAGTPAKRLAARIAGKNAAKCSVAPSSVNASCVVAATTTASKATTNADNDHGFSPRRQSVLLRIKNSP